MPKEVPTPTFAPALLFFAFAASALVPSLLVLPVSLLPNTTPEGAGIFAAYMGGGAGGGMIVFPLLLLYAPRCGPAWLIAWTRRLGRRWTESPRRAILIAWLTGTFAVWWGGWQSDQLARGVVGPPLGRAVMLGSASALIGALTAFAMTRRLREAAMQSRKDQDA